MGVTKSSKPTAKPSSTVRVLNRQRYQIHLDVQRHGAGGHLDKDPKGVTRKNRYVLGSVDDRKNAEAASPECRIPRVDWDLLLRQKAVMGMIKDGTIEVLPG